MPEFENRTISALQVGISKAKKRGELPSSAGSAVSRQMFDSIPGPKKTKPKTKVKPKVKQVTRIPSLIEIERFIFGKEEFATFYNRVFVMSRKPDRGTVLTVLKILDQMRYEQ